MAELFWWRKTTIYALCKYIELNKRNPLLKRTTALTAKSLGNGPIILEYTIPYKLCYVLYAVLPLESIEGKSLYPFLRISYIYTYSTAMCHA